MSKIKPHVFRSSLHPGLWAACLAVHEPTRGKPGEGRMLRPCTGVAGEVGHGITTKAAILNAKARRAAKYKLNRKEHDYVGSTRS